MVAALHHADVSALFDALIIVCLLVGVYFLVKREFVGAAAAVIVAFLIAVLFG